MIKQEIYLEKYDWNVIVCHVANQEDVDEAMDLLSSIDCKGQPLLDAYDHISTDSSNKGLTYTNVSKKTSVVLICKSTSEGEYINSLTHEMFHVVAHICNHLGIGYARRRTMLSYGMALSVDIIEDFLISLTWWADLGFFHLPSYKITRI